MKITVDLNVFLDVAQNRQPHYASSEEVLRRGRNGEFEIILPSHALTTLHYVLEKFGGADLANATIDGLLADFGIHAVARENFMRARNLSLKDFEDAVVGAVAESSESQFIVTRNGADFLRAPVRAITPSDFLEILAAIQAD